MSNNSIQNNDILLPSEIDEIMTLINSFRTAFEGEPITYDSNLSLISHDVAINLLKSQIRKYPYISPIDNNLSRSCLFIKHVRNNKLLNIKNTLNKWYKENTYCNFDSPDHTKHCENFINLVCEEHIKCGIGYSYANGKCAVCIHFSEV